ncbi:hypothetical protein [Leucobacter chromiiresistens]|uniref:hypothetical protein n=1 Tax=Leucobacter chromiiresistens TaxID=1079994 RepID=UPI0012DE57CF|nr:hypothetical protein [Leucobacter chromiiresistens]
MRDTRGFAGVHGKRSQKTLSKRNLIVMQYLQRFLEALLTEEGADYEDELES